MAEFETEEITLAELTEQDTSTFLLVDIRDAVAFSHGSIPGAVNMEASELLAGKAELPAEKEIVCFCMWGILSKEVAASLCERGLHAVSLRDGYAQWLRNQMTQEKENTERRKRAEDSIRRKFHKDLFTRFGQAIGRYDLVQPGDRIAVCISGGKDSMLMAKLFQELKRHNKIPFELVFLVMDPGYNQVNREVIESNAALLGIPIQIFETKAYPISAGRTLSARDCPAEKRSSFRARGTKNEQPAGLTVGCSFFCILL